MNSRGRSVPFLKLAALQDLAATEERRLLGIACDDTDRCRVEEAELAVQLAAAEADLDSVHADERLCLVRLRLAAAAVDIGDTALTKGRERLRGAVAAEERVSAAWHAARHRAGRLADHARMLRRRDEGRRDMAAEREALMLRLALGGRDAIDGTRTGETKP